MKASIDKNGMITLQAEDGTEAYAMKCWLKDHEGNTLPRGMVMLCEPERGDEDGGSPAMQAAPIALYYHHADTSFPGRLSEEYTAKVAADIRCPNCHNCDDYLAKHADAFEGLHWTCHKCKTRFRVERDLRGELFGAKFGGE